MRFAITALGSSGGRTVGQVVDDIVRYLEPRQSAASPGGSAVPSGAGPSSYYADRGTEPGRWLGHGASDAGLSGEVDPSDFARVLAGRDPRSGTRLITARGSAGRRAFLGAGTETMTTPAGQPLFAVADAAATLGISHREATALIAAGQRVAVGALAGMDSSDPAGSYLVPVIDGDGTPWVADEELRRCELARSRGSTAAEVAATGHPDDLLSLTEAARLSGLTARYLRGLCKRWESDRDGIERDLQEKGSTARAYLVAYRGLKSRWLVKRGDLAGYLDRRTAPAVRVGFDVTLTTEKSLGVLALLGNAGTRAGVLDAIQSGNDSGIGYLEYQVSARRKGEPVLTRGLTVASFRHLTSRALDPFPHHHNVVANTVEDEYGTRRALDARHLYWHARGASAVATAQMRYELTGKLGVQWRQSRSGGWEVAGISDEVIREFSRRRNEIDEAVAGLEEAIGRMKTIDELQSIVLATRPQKEEVDPRDLVAAWWERAIRHGLSPATLDYCVGRFLPVRLHSQEEVFRHLADPLTGVCASSSIFTRSDVLAALADMPVRQKDGTLQPLIVSGQELEHLADEFLASALVMQLDQSAVPHRSQLKREEIFTTAEILSVQRRIVDAARRGAGSGAARVPLDILRHMFRETPSLSAEQRGLVKAFCTSGHALQCAIGRAGAGKTTAMRAAAGAWGRAGFRVVGAAVKGEAARLLSAEAGVPAETVAWYLARADATTLPLDARTVLIIDEASTLSDRDLDALLTMAAKAGAAVRLIGDPDQHGAVAAGGVFRHLCEILAEDTPELVTSHRLRDPADQSAARALRAGDTAEALQFLQEAGHLHVAENHIELYVGMLHRWWEARLAGDHHPMVDRRHATRRQLNRLARHLLRANGDLGPEEISASGDRRFAVGDRVVARMAARHLHVTGNRSRYVRNGATGTVVAVHQGPGSAGDRLHVEFDAIGAIEVPRAFFDEHAGPGGRIDVGIDHAYAVTSYAVQGATYETSTSRIDEDATRGETYVDITRGRASNHLFLTRAPDPLDGEHLPKVPPPPLVSAVGNALGQSGPERAAIDVDRSLVEPQPTRESWRLPAEARLARQSPPPDLAALLPPRSSTPHLARQWDRAITEIVAYRVRFTPQPGTGPHARALGAAPTGPHAAAARDTAAAAIDALAVSTVAEALRQRGARELPPWAAIHVQQLAVAGPLSTDTNVLTDLYSRIGAYRQAAGIPDDATSEDHPVAAVLGPPPEDGLLRVAYRGLAAELAALEPPDQAVARAL